MVNDIYFINNSTGWALDYGGSTQKTTNGGITWSPLGSISNFYAMRILMIDTLQGWIAAYNYGSSTDGKGYIYKTTNGGFTWVQDYVTPLVGTDLADLKSQNNSTLWCTGNNSTILKYDIPTGIIKIWEIITDYKLNQNYPNPFNPNTNISFAIPKKSNVNLTVYDINGRELSKLIINELKAPGRYEIEFDGSKYSSGIYFYKISAGEYTRIKKMVLLK